MLLLKHRIILIYLVSKNATLIKSAGRLKRAVSINYLSKADIN